MKKNTKKNTKHPRQYTDMTARGVNEFRENKIVSELLRLGPLSMREIDRMDFDLGDRRQFAQLQGFTVHRTGRSGIRH